MKTTMYRKLLVILLLFSTQLMSAEPTQNVQLKPQDRIPECQDFEMCFWFWWWLDQSMSPECQYLMDYTAETLSSLSEEKVYVYGYTDSRGSVTYNHKLSYHRAKWLAGVVKERMSVEKEFELIGKGYKNPIVSNATEECEHELNRRVEFRLK